VPITYGRADLAALARTFAGKLSEDRKAANARRDSGHEEKQEIPSALSVITFEAGWNADGKAVIFEAETLEDFVPGKKLNVQAKDERGLVREIRWRIAEWLRMEKKVPAAEARDKARSWPVFIADRLARRPNKGEIITGV